VRRSWVVAAVLVLAVAAACSSTHYDETEAGTCPATPGADCKNQDLRSVSLVAADLHNIDFSGSDLSDADFRNANLTGANLSGTTLAGTDFSGATLRDANLTKAFLFGANLTDADLTGADRTGSQVCNVTEPDGALNNGFVVNAQGKQSSCGKAALPSLTAPPTGPPRISYFRLSEPRECVNDVAGDGIDVEWSTSNVNTIAIFVDGLQVDAETKARGSHRLPFVCDNRPHLVSMQAFGTQPPAATSSFAATFPPAAPLTSSG
jgi:Pentapeptide repeats (8 copies)